MEIWQFWTLISILWIGIGGIIYLQIATHDDLEDTVKGVEPTSGDMEDRIFDFISVLLWPTAITHVIAKRNRKNNLYKKDS